MIRAFDEILRDVILAGVPGITTRRQVRFQAPDEDWRSYVSTLTVQNQPANAVNVYLVEVRENRKLRSNETELDVVDGIVTARRAPTRYECHYLLSAWSGASVTPPIEPALDEHRVLTGVVEALVRAAPINPSRVYPAGSATLAAVPEEIRESDLPTEVLPAAGYPNLGQFWETMGTRGRWRPAAYLIVTLPVRTVAEPAGPEVTTLFGRYRITNGSSGPAETQLNLGGRVLDVDGEVVAGAWVRIERPAGEPVAETVTDDLGRFRFDGLQPTSYSIKAGALGVGADERTLDVPSTTGEYDLHLA